MKQEEIKEQAEKYTNSIDTLIYDIYDNAINIALKLEQAFQDGAKWGMEHAIQWHDLRKNPEDLPKGNGKYWCKLSNGLYLECTYDYDLKFWFGKTQRKIIAWCELPQFKE